MTERNYYIKFKESLNLPLLKYFSKLNFEDWLDFFEDYYRHELIYLLRILDTPKGEDIYSYGLIWVKNVDSETKELITRANDKLLSVFIAESNPELLEEIFKVIRYLKLDVSKDLLFKIICDKNGIQKTRELAAITLISVHEYSASTFWDNLDLKQDLFLIPSYIAFHRRNNPVKGLEKLKLISERPINIEVFETPVLYSLLQVSTSDSSIEEFKILQCELPSWVTTFIKELFDEYPELDSFKEKVKRPYEDILERIGLDYSIWNEFECEFTSKEIMDSVKILKSSLNILLKQLKDKPDLIDIVNQNEVTLIDPIYIPDLSTIFKNLKNKLIGLLGEENIYDPINDQVFEPLSNLFLYEQPSVFLYPYFLDEYRMQKKGAGVIAYAKQTSMSIVINKRNPLFYEWEAIREENFKSFGVPKTSQYDRYRIDDVINEFICTEWFKKLVLNIYKNKGSIYTISGYIFDSLLQQFTKQHFGPVENRKMIEVLREPIPIERINIDLPFYKLHNARNPITNLYEILLLDPADARKISNNGKSDELSKLNTDFFDIITIKHGLDVFVGLGFSLFALPRLLKQNIWKELQDYILSELRNQNDTFKNAGINLFQLESNKINQQITVKV